MDNNTRSNEDVPSAANYKNIAEARHPTYITGRKARGEHTSTLAAGDVTSLVILTRFRSIASFRPSVLRLPLSLTPSSPRTPRYHYIHTALPRAIN
ncbi:hypothetical protein EVAR_41353_1 [Eumeta japonica]|uniref:Uncharacterized protein n=1 Tax=Eumeta variegata TaxID=151549 RepID=A0A4C1XN89_EUMVA|nr:hypothetical protein EVAR_41353_1 [Eumeta japonica]